MPLDPVADRPSLVDQVHERLVAAICAGELPAGAPLVQERLAESLDVSRQPVLQALAMLRRDGFAERAGRRGYCVAPVTQTLVRDVYAVRAALDRLAAGDAARRSDAGAAKALEAAIAEGTAAMAAGETARLVAADVEFHQLIYRLSGNVLIPETAAPLWRHIRRVMAAVLRRGDARAAVWREHEEIAAAIVAGAPERAERLAAAHAERAADHLIQRLDSVDAA